MIFLIEYNRLRGSIYNITRFDDFERSKAEKLRLEIELNLNRREVENFEVVLLEAASEEALRRTHRRRCTARRRGERRRPGGVQSLARISFFIQRWHEYFADQR